MSDYINEFIDSETIFYDITSESELEINLNSYHLDDFFNVLYANPNKKFSIKIITKKTIAFGRGSTNQFITLMANQMIDYILEYKDNFFVDIKLNSNFWWNICNIKKFILFLRQAYLLDIKLPFHFSPLFLSHIFDIKLEKNDYIEYLKIIDNEIYKNIIEITDDVFKDIYMEGTKEIFIKNKINKYFRHNNGNTLEYKRIRKYFAEYKNPCFINSIVNIDRIISGAFIISGEYLIKNTIISPCVFEDEIHIFFNSLNNKEIKNFIYLATGSYSTNYSIYIKIRLLTVDIKFETCFKEVIINEELLSENKLNKLKELYLSFDDHFIKDGINLNPTITNKEQNDQQEYSTENYIPVNNTPFYDDNERYFIMIHPNTSNFIENSIDLDAKKQNNYDKFAKIIKESKKPNYTKNDYIKNIKNQKNKYKNNKRNNLINKQSKNIFRKTYR